MSEIFISLVILRIVPRVFYIHRWMKQLNYYGMSLLQNAPAVEMELVKVSIITVTRIALSSFICFCLYNKLCFNCNC